MSDEGDYRPREHDHLVEPMFAGLGAERSDAPARRGVLARCLAWLGRLLRGEGDRARDPSAESDERRRT